MIDPVFRTGKNYYPRIFLEEFKHVKKEKMPECISDNIEISFDSDRVDSDEEISNEENSDEENSNEKS